MVLINDVKEELNRDLDKYDWFHSVETENKYIVIYVNWQSLEIMQLIPEYLYGFVVKIATSQFLNCGEKYNKISLLGEEN